MLPVGAADFGEEVGWAAAVRLGRSCKSWGEK